MSGDRHGDRLVQELQQKVDSRLQGLFRARRRFTVSNYRPPTGIGLFDLCYDIDLRTVDVKVKVRFNFLNNGPGKQSTYIDWTEAEKVAFRTKALKVCHDAWAGKYKFQCTRKGWEQFNAKVDISMVEDPAPHYEIDSRKVAQTDPTAWSGGCEHGAKIWPYKANFSNWGVETRRDFMGTNIFNFKEKQLNEILRRSGLQKIPIAAGKVDVDSDLRLWLDGLARRVSQIIQDDVSGIHCNIYAFSSTYYDWWYYQDMRATRLADHLNNRLKAFGSSGSFFRASKTAESQKVAEAILRRGNTNPKGFDGVCLFIDVPPASPRVVLTHYIIITHEFGHMLGCPDEYYGVLCTGTQALMSVDQIVQATFSQPLLNANQLNPPGPGRHFLTERMSDAAPENVRRLHQQQKMFAYQVQQAGVTSPYFMAQNTPMNQAEIDASTTAWYAERERIKQVHGRDSPQYQAHSQTTWAPAKTGASDSIMFTGQKVLPAHYLPLWSCLTSATREFLDPSEWSIVST